MRQYTFFASVYDEMMDNIPYEEWEIYILQLMFRYGMSPCGSIAELGCGTGTMSGLFADDGFDVTGIDISEDMLAIAEKKYPMISFIKADMRDFKLSEKKDAIISICDSMNYLLTVDNMYRTFKAVRNNLKEGGIFIFDLKTAFFYENVLDGRTFRGHSRDISYVWKNKYDAIKGIHEYLLSFKKKGDRSNNKYTELHRQRVFSAADIKTAALRAGFSKAAAYDAFTFDKPRKNSERIYIVLSFD